MSDPNDELEFTFEGESLTISFDENYVDDIPDGKVSAPEPEGFNCSRCHEFYQYAKANQPDGSFKCWGCRH